MQETLLSALQSRFDGRSSRRTWLISILRRRMVDRLRRTDEGRAERMLDDAVKAMFDRGGTWAHRTRAWPAGGDLDELRAALVTCLDRLPVRSAEAFLLVEHDGVPVFEAAAMLGTTPGNVHVIMHRARLALRACLEQRDVAPRRGRRKERARARDQGPTKGPA